MTEKIDLKTISYMLGIFSIVFAFFNAYAGLVLGIIGLVQAKKLNSPKAKKLNTVGVVLSGIFVLISLGFLIYSLITGGTAIFPSL
jgi:hypothetical protein